MVSRMRSSLAIPSHNLSPTEPALASRFGARVRELRKIRGVSQAALARTLGIGTGTVARFERGATFPGDRIQAIADALGVEPVELFNFGLPPGPHPAELTAIVALVQTAAAADPLAARRILRILRAALEK